MKITSIAHQLTCLYKIANHPLSASIFLIHQTTTIKLQLDGLPLIYCMAIN